MNTILTIIIFWAIFFIITAITHYIYIVRTFEIKPWSYFDHYPFICFKCMTTWSLITTYIMAGVLMADLTFTLLGITLSGLYGYGLNKLEKERTITNEDNR